VPARDAYLPRLVGDPDGSDTWQAVTVAGGWVDYYHRPHGVPGGQAPPNASSCVSDDPGLLINGSH
jgi:hypothetical protein